MHGVEWTQPCADRWVRATRLRSRWSELLLSAVIVTGRPVNERARETCAWRERFGGWLECDLGLLWSDASAIDNQTESERTSCVPLLSFLFLWDASDVRPSSSTAVSVVPVSRDFFGDRRLEQSRHRRVSSCVGPIWNWRCRQWSAVEKAAPSSSLRGSFYSAYSPFLFNVLLRLLPFSLVMQLGMMARSCYCRVIRTLAHPLSLSECRNR